MKHSLKKNKILDLEIEKVKEKLEKIDPEENPESYFKLMDVLEKLQDLKEKEKRFKVKQDTIFNGAVTIGGILLVTFFEIGNVISSKGFSFIPRGRV